jgi:methylated-DNA-protein-cysteine methyltransferase-like protein
VKLAQRVYHVVEKIPPGKAAGYGVVGQCVDPPVSGLLVGRIMGRCEDSLPWWRVVARDGHLPVAKRDLALEQQQLARLKREGVEFDDKGRVLPRFLLSVDELITWI